MSENKYLIVVPVIDMKKFNNNVARSLFFKKTQAVILKGFKNVSEAQNKALMAYKHYQYIIFVHEDVFLPDTFEDDLETSINMLEKSHPNWYIAGAAGAFMEKGERKMAGWVLDRGSNWGSKVKYPKKVDSVDELIMVVNAKYNIKFDEKLPYNHFYSSSLSLAAKKKGKETYVINAYCEHNSDHAYKDDDFYEAEYYMLLKWTKYLPFATTCSLLEN